MTNDILDRNITLENIIDKFNQDDVYYETKNSEISKFYAGKYVFLTGGTGFLGKLLIEKLLRACPEIAGIFMLARAKKGKDPHTRTDEIFNDPLFGKLSKLQPKFRHKIVLVNGDLVSSGLGMTIEDREQITDKASIFIHSAATVKFNEKLHIAVDINIKGTKEMLTLAKECKRLDAFVHISTAFSQCVQPTIDEEIYDVPFDDERIIQICKATPTALLEKITPDLLGEWPNTYVFTKAIAEDCIKKYGSQLPICIVRPAVVIGTYKEPLKSWIDNIYGATGIVVGAGVGLLRVAPINPDGIAEIIPGDMVANLIITAGYNTAIERHNQIPVYNHVTTKENRINWRRFMALNAYYGVISPSERALWIYTLKLTHIVYLYHIYVFLYHTIPGLVMDGALLLIGKKPQILSIYRKIQAFSDTIAYFGDKTFSFKYENTVELYKNLSEEDKKLFFFDMSKLDWHKYFTVHCLGLRTHLLKEDLASIPKAKRRQMWFAIAHNLIKLLLVGLLLRLTYALLLYLFN